MSRILLFANTTWYLYNFRSALARAIQDAGHEVIFVSPYDEYADRLQARGDRWVPFELSRRGVNPVVETATILRCAGLYKAFRPDLVHHFTIKPVLYGSVAARAAAVPFVVNSVTGLGYAFVAPGLRGGILRVLARTWYRAALGGRRTRVIFENATDLEAFVCLGLVAPDRAVVVPGTGVDVQAFCPTAEPMGEPVVLMASRMLWDKGVGDLVEAARILQGRGVRARVVLVGAPDPGNPTSIAESQLLAWTDSGIVEWRGRLEGMAEVYAGCHVVVLPSHREGLPRNLVEAAAAGRPIVATDVPGCRDVVRHGVNGLLVPPHNPAALAEALQELISSPERRREMGARGRELAVSVFSDDHVIRGTLDVYASLLGTPLPVAAHVG